MLKCKTCKLNKAKHGQPVQCERYEGYSLEDMDYYCSSNGTYEERPHKAYVGFRFEG